MLGKLCVSIMLLISTACGTSWAQTDAGSVKIFSGYLHRYTLDKKPWWGMFSSKRFPKQEEISKTQQCSIAFKSPMAFTPNGVDNIPAFITYTISCQGPYPPPQNFKIKLHSNDEIDYTIDPAEEGKPFDINDEHRITDTYLIYMILSQEKVKYLEIPNPATGHTDKYVLDKMEIQNQ